MSREKRKQRVEIRTIPGVLVVAALMMATGCSNWIAKPIDVTAPSSKKDAFKRCVVTPRGTCPALDAAFAERPASRSVPLRPFLGEAPPVPEDRKAVAGARGETERKSLAMATVRELDESPAQQAFINLHEDLSRGETDPSATRTISARDLADYAIKLEKATVLGAWDDLEQTAVADLVDAEQAKSLTAASFDELVKDPEVAGKAQRARTAVFVKAYVKAYFRNGKFASLTLDYAEFKKRLQDELKSQFPFLKEADLEDLVNKQIEKVFPKGSKPFGVVADTSLVSRDGESIQFPAVNATVTLATRPKVTVGKLDGTTLGSDLIRVVLMGVFDSFSLLPAVGNATGVVGVPGDVKLEVFAAGNREFGNMTDDDFASVKDWSNRAEAVSSAAFGRVIRGVSWFSLNNESLATLLETGVGVTVRKASEKLVWCAYACGVVKHGEPAAKRVADVKADEGLPDVNTVHLRVTK